MERNKNPLNFYVNTAKSILSIKFFIGILLIGIGVWAAITIVLIVYKIFMDTSSVPFLKQIINSGQEVANLMAANNGDEVGVSYKILGFVVSFIFLSIASRLAVKIIEVGFKIIDKLEFKYMMQKIWDEWQKTKKMAEHQSESKLPGSSHSERFK